MAEECPKCPPVGAPTWLATFADLMSLLMCFFVLLLSFATMDISKFKKLAGSMNEAFGVQSSISANKIPMGTSIIAQHFSPAQTTPSAIDEIKQSTEQEDEKLSMSVDDMEQAKQQLLQIKLDEIKVQAEQIVESLDAEIKEGLVSVETDGLKIVIRIDEKGSFPSGAAVLKAGFEPVMEKITEAVNVSVGEVYVAGHTDNIPISTDWYRSNWELSASRSVTVAHFMLSNKETNPERIIIQGYADTRPLVDNNSAENRAKNRRVEIVIAQDDPTLGLKAEELSDMIQTDNLTDKSN
ncbi:MAG: OmpA family protein [Methylococcales bacterium]|nr:OmpA family protein [Methylococcales bacterium]